MVYIILFIIAFLAFSVSAVSGGGAGLLLIPVLGFVLPAMQIPSALTVATFVSSASKIYFFHKHIRFDILKWFFPASLPGVFVGVELLRHIESIYISFFHRSS